jgi:hypothetical protein
VPAAGLIADNAARKFGLFHGQNFVGDSPTPMINRVY